MSFFSRDITPDQYHEAKALVETSKTQAIDAKKLKSAIHRIDKYEEAEEYAALTPEGRAIYDKVKKYRDILSPAFSMFLSALPDEITKAIPENFISIIFKYVIRPERIIDDLNKKIEYLAKSIGIPSQHIAFMISKPGENSDAVYEIMVFSPHSNTWEPVRYDLRDMLRKKQIRPNFGGQIKADMLSIYNGTTKALPA